MGSEVCATTKATYYLELVDSPHDNAKNKHVILLHGWGKNRIDMLPWLHKIQLSACFTDASIWNVNYPTHLKFTEAATQIQAMFKDKEQLGYVFEEVYFLGYSMGGIIARQMVADGFPVTKLVTICAPHHGVNRYILPVNAGVKSLQPSSQEMKALNANVFESGMRSCYLLCAVDHTFKLPFGQISRPQGSDTVVSRTSAIGEGLSGNPANLTVTLHVPRLFPKTHNVPHMAGMDPAHFEGVLPFFIHPCQGEQSTKIKTGRFYRS